MEERYGERKGNLVIVGAGGFGRELLQWVKDSNRLSGKWNIVGFIDDNRNALDGHPCDYRVVGTIREWEPEDGQVFACAVAKPQIKAKIVAMLKERGAVFTSVVHPTAFVGESSVIGEGIVMYPHSGITANVEVGDFVTLLGSLIGHDAVVGDYCTISSFCDITGGVRLAEKVFLGSHVTVVPGRKIGPGAYVAAGSVVMTNIKGGSRVMGNPAGRMDF